MDIDESGFDGEHDMYEEDLENMQVTSQDAWAVIQ